MLSSANPALNDSTFTRHVDLTGEDRMTVMGTVNKTIALALIMLVTASCCLSTALLLGRLISVTFRWLGLLKLLLHS